MEGDALTLARLKDAHKDAVARRDRILGLERDDIGKVNRKLERERLSLRRIVMDHGEESLMYQNAKEAFDAAVVKLEARYDEFSREAQGIKEKDALYTVSLKEVNGRQKVIPLSQLNRFNGL